MCSLCPYLSNGTTDFKRELDCGNFYLLLQSLNIAPANLHNALRGPLWLCQYSSCVSTSRCTSWPITTDHMLEFSPLPPASWTSWSNFSQNRSTDWAKTRDCSRVRHQSYWSPVASGMLKHWVKTRNNLIESSATFSSRQKNISRGWGGSTSPNRGVIFLAPTSICLLLKQLSDRFRNQLTSQITLLQWNRLEL